MTTWQRELCTWRTDYDCALLGSGMSIEERNARLHQLKACSGQNAVVINLEALGLGLIKRAKSRLARAEEELAKAIKDSEHAQVIAKLSSAVGRAQTSLTKAKAAGELDDVLLSIDWDILIVDESHRIKDPNGAVQRAVRRIARRTPHVVLASGTWMPHDALDVFAPIRILDESRQTAFGTNFFVFKNAIAVMSRYHPGIEGLKLEEGSEFYDPAIAKWFSRVMDRHVTIKEKIDLKLADPVAQFRSHPLPPKVRALYDQLRDELAIDLAEFAQSGSQDWSEDDEDLPAEGVVLPPNTLVRILRLSQLASGGLPLDDSEERIQHTARLDLLCETIADVGKDPIVIGGWFKHELEFARRAAAKHKRSYGEISARRKDGLDDQGRMAPVDIVGVQYKAGGEGIDLTRANIEILIGHLKNLGLYTQVVGRVHRPGQLSTVNLIHLLAEDTHDLDVYDALRRRRNINQAITEGILARRSAKVDAVTDSVTRCSLERTA